MDRGPPVAHPWRKALRRGKYLVFSEDTCLEKERVLSKVTPRNVGVELKRRRERSKKRLGWRSVCWGSNEKKEASHLLGLRGRHQYSDQRSNRNRVPCSVPLREFIIKRDPFKIRVNLKMLFYLKFIL